MSSSSPSAAHLRRLVALLGALVLLPLSIVLSATPAQAAANVLSGSVQDVIGDDIAGVSVQLVDPGAPGGTLSSVSSDGSGNFELPVTEGSYQLRFVKAGFDPTWYGDETHAVIVVDEDGAASVDGEPLEDNALAAVTMTSSATFAVPGTVQATGGANLSGITVNAYHEGDEDGPVQATATTTNGAYTLQLGIGEYVVRAVDNDTVTDPETYDAVWLTPADSTAHSVVRVGQGGAFKVDGTTKTNLPTIIMPTSSADTPHPVSGEVEDANGDPVGGVTVTPTDGPTTTTATTASDGTYTLMLKPGTYTLGYAKSGYTSTTYPSSVVVALDGTVTPGSTLESVALADAVGDATISGRVVNSVGGAGLNGISVEVFPAGDDFTGTPVATTTTATVSGTSGSWSVSTLKIGTYDIRFSGTSGGSSFDATYYGGTTPASATAVKVGQNNVVTVGGATQADGALGSTTMTQSSADTPHPVTGKVEDVNDDPIGGVTVTPADGPTTTAATTASDGTYTLMLKPGTYTIGYAKSGFNSTTYPSSVVVALDGTVTPASALESVTLADAVGDATISGRVVNSVGGAGLNGITVDVFAAGGDFSGSPVASTTTATVSGTAGSWSVATLKIGTYDVRFSGTSGGSSYDATYYGGTTPATTTPVKVGQGNVVTVGGATKAGGALGSTAMTQSSADTPHPVTGKVEDVNDDAIGAVTVTPSGGPTTATTTTASDGTYTLMLKPGTYQLGYAKSGFTSTTYPASVTVALDGTVTPASPLEPVTLADAVGDATISGQVTNSAGGGGLNGITVEVFAAGGDFSGTPVASTTTATVSGTAGSWSVGTLKIGTYDVRFSGTSGGSSYDATYYGGTTPTTTTPVKVGQGNTVTVGGFTKVNGALGGTSMTQSSADTPHPVTGEVEDVNGDPIGGVTVTPTDGPTTTTATTGAEGTYTLMLKPGTYTLGYAKSGFTSATYPTSVTVALDGTVTPASPLEPVTLADATGDATISGQVTNSAGGAGLNGITVEVFPAGDFAAESRVATTTTATVSGTAGSWSVSTLKIGTYDVRFSGTSGGASYDATYYGGTTPGTTTPVKVGQNNVVTVGGFTKASGALGTTSMTQSSADTPHPVSGEVEDGNDDPIGSVTVTPSGGPTTTAATTASDGTYTLMLKPGTYTLTYAKSGYTSTTYPSSVVVALDGTVTPASPLEPVTLADATGDATISGQVINSVGGAGLNGITVDVFPAGDFTGTPVATTTTATVSGTAGSWSVGTLKIGTYDIRFSGTSGGASYDATYYGGTTPTTTTPVKVGQGNTVTVGGFTKLNGALGATSMTQSSADTPHPVTGEVNDANDDPIGTVTVTPSGGPTTTAATTASDGTYTLMLKPGTYTLTYSKSGYTPTTYPGSGLPSQSVTVALDGTVTPASPLEPVTLADSVGDATISGQVVNSVGGAGLNGITVEVFPAGDFTAESRVATTTTATVSGTAGSWSVATLKIGTYDIRFSGASGGVSYDATYYGGSTPTSTTPVKVGQGNVVTVGGFTKAGGALGTTSMTQSSADTPHPVSGEVNDANDDPIGAATVTPSGGPTTTAATTASDGTYTLMLKPGTYTLTYSKSGYTSTTYPGSGEPTQTVTVALDGTVTPASPLEPVVLADATGDATISGRVVNSVGGAGLNGITVEVFPAGDFTAESRVATTTTATVSGTAGSWSVGTLKIGTYDIRFSGASGGITYDQTYFGGSTPATTTPVKVGQSNVVSVDGFTKAGGALGSTAMTAASASSTYEVVGTVSDPNGDPINGVAVAATKQGGGVTSATSNADGGYTLTLGIGTYTIAFTKSGFSPTSFTGGGEGAATVKVAAGGAVTVTVDDEVTPVTGGDIGDTTMPGTLKYNLSGTVVSSTTATGLKGITVQARVSGDSAVVGSATTGNGGAFTLSLPINTYQISFSGVASDDKTYPVTYFGGSSASEVKVAFDGKYYFEDEVLASFGNVALTPNTGNTRFDLAGTVSGLPPDYLPLDGVTVTAVPVSGTAADAGGVDTTGPDPKDGELGDSGVYRIPVKAGKFQVKFSKAGYQPTFLPDANDPNKPATVTVSSLGNLSAPDYDFSQGYIDDVSMKTPAAVFSTKPALAGKVVPGQKLTLSFGKLQGVAFSKDVVTVEWFVDGKLDEDNIEGDYSEKFLVPAAAATKKLSYRITIDPSLEDEEYLKAPSVFTSTPVTIAKAPAKLKGVFKKGKLTVTLAVPTVKKPLGTIIVKDGKKKVATIKLTAKSKGKAVVALKLKPGKHKLTLSYAGSKTVNKAKATVKVTIKK